MNESLQRKTSIPAINPIIENFRENPYRVKGEQAKDAYICGNIRWELEGKNLPKTSLK